VADRVLILGASARAAAASARRAGLEPLAIDLFADADTRQICDCLRCPQDEYPEGLFRLARQAPPIPWMYTGGLENYPELIAELARERELLGNGPPVLAQVRDPFQLAELAASLGIRHPDITPERDCPSDGTLWVRKPFSSSGGFRLQLVDRPFPRVNGWYYQRYVEGVPMSAVVALQNRNVCGLGITRQLIGQPWLHARRFAYCGNVSSTGLNEEWLASWVWNVALSFADQCNLRQLWGFDFISQDSALVLIEVNPRYPASTEVVEFATSRPVLAAGLEGSARPARIVGKAVYYAPHRFTFPASGPWHDSVRRAADVWRRPDFADVPHPGEVIEAGHPVLTILAEADTDAGCLARLQSRAEELDRLFGFPTPEGESCRP
jgi:predicted ATP-grasp superfamily ATP-dependent carboligase